MRSNFKRNREILLKNLFEENGAISDRRKPWKQTNLTRDTFRFSNTRRDSIRYDEMDGIVDSEEESMA